MNVLGLGAFFYNSKKKRNLETVQLWNSPRMVYEILKNVYPGLNRGVPPKFMSFWNLRI